MAEKIYPSGKTNQPIKPRYNAPHPAPWSQRKALTATRTYSADSAVIYKRKKHYMTEQDIARLIEKIRVGTSRTPEEEEVGVDFTWWQKIINWLSRWMLGKILGVAGLDEDAVDVLWYGANSLWDDVIVQVVGPDDFIVKTKKLFEDRFKAALDEYMKPAGAGDKLLDRLFADLIGKE